MVDAELWSGVTVEAGVLRRGRDVTFQPENEPIVGTQSATYAGRAMVGWSWEFHRLFVAIAAGVSIGREGGQETITPDRTFQPHAMVTSSDVGRLTVDAEGYFRIGFAYDKQR